jgi:uncharacterized protein (DUF779 family)
MTMTANDALETISCGAGVLAHIYSDDSPPNPRTDHDNLGVMACWHRVHGLGDYTRYKHRDRDHTEPIHKDPYTMWSHLLYEMAPTDRQLWPVIRTALLDPDTGNDYAHRFRGMSSKDRRGQWIDFLSDLITEQVIDLATRTAFRKMLIDMGLVIKTLYLYDHSGITISTGPFGDKWDSGPVGYIYLTPKKIMENWSVTSLDAPVHYPHDNTTETARVRAEEVLDGEVETYDQYLTGDVYSVTIETPDEEVVEACGGHFGMEWAREAAREMADYYVKLYTDPERDLGDGI